MVKIRTHLPFPFIIFSDTFFINFDLYLTQFTQICKLLLFLRYKPTVDFHLKLLVYCIILDFFRNPFFIHAIKVLNATIRAHNTRRFYRASIKRGEAIRLRTYMVFHLYHERFSVFWKSTVAAAAEITLWALVCSGKGRVCKKGLPAFSIIQFIWQLPLRAARPVCRIYLQQEINP